MEYKGIEISLTEDELKKVIEILGREPNEVEIGMIDIMWSEHASYKSSRPVLKILPKEGKRVLVGPGQDAGVIDIGDGKAVAFKIESHNHPSAIEPYNGAATGIGGIVRDILCMGARPIGLMDSLRFGSPEDPHTRWLIRNVVKGIADYGNCIGVPTVAGEIEFDESYSKNCLVNVGCFGVGNIEDVAPSKAEHPGHLLVLAGGSTGRDGIHGVTFASKTLSDESEEERHAVQIGDPFIKKKIIEATLEIVHRKLAPGIKDLGGGGLTCASSEMAEGGNTGVVVHVDKVFTREPNMTPYEIMLSESQERMLYEVPPENLEEIKKVFEKYELTYAIVGEVTDSGRVIVKNHGETVADLPVEILADPPVIIRQSKEPARIKEIKNRDKPDLPRNFKDAFLKVISAPSIASKEWVYRQYDHEVGVRTVSKPNDSEAAVMRILGTNKGLAIKSDGNALTTYADPYWGAAGALAEACRNVASTGAEPVAFVDGCNFGSPEDPEVFWEFEQAIKGLADMGRAFGLPCVGGNVSFYNQDETTGKAIKPVPIVVVLGLIDNLERDRAYSATGISGKIVLVGDTYPEMGGSEYYKQVHGTIAGIVPKVRVDEEKKNMNFVISGIRNKTITYAIDISKGGIAAALTKLAVRSGKGLSVNLDDLKTNGLRIDEVLFSESHGRYLLVVPKDLLDSLIEDAKKLGISVRVLGDLSNHSEISIRISNEHIKFDLKELKDAWQDSLKKILTEV